MDAFILNIVMSLQEVSSGVFQSLCPALATVTGAAHTNDTRSGSVAMMGCFWTVRLASHTVQACGLILFGHLRMELVSLQRVY